MNRKRLSVGLFLTVCCFWLALQGSLVRAEERKSGKWTYEVLDEANKTAAILRRDLDPQEPNIQFPSVVTGYTVVRIGTLGKNDPTASALAKVTWNAKKGTMTSESYVRRIRIPYTVKEIGDGAFAGCTELYDVQFGIDTRPSTVSVISCYAFYGCTSLKEMTIPEGVIGIYGKAFSGCTALKTIHLPKSLKILGDAVCGDAFDEGNTALEEIIVAEGSTTCASEDGVLFADPGKRSIFLYPPAKKEKTYTVPSSVISLPAGSRGFGKAGKLKTLTIAGTMEKLEAGSLAGVSKVFFLQETVPELVTGEAGGSQEPVFAEGATIKVPAAFKADWKTVLDAYNALFPERKPVTISGFNALKGMEYTSPGNGLKYIVTKEDKEVALIGFTTKKTKVIVPDTVTIGTKSLKVISIEKEAFKKNTKLKTLVLGKNITSIGDEAFSGCKKLKTVTFGDKIKTIGNSAFENCAVLASIDLPAAVAKIGSNAFSGCKKLTAITIRSEKLTDPTVGTNAFAGVPETAKVNLPKAKYSAYKKWLKKKGLTKKNKFAKLK